MAGVVKLIGRNPLQLVFVIGFDFFTEDAHVEGCMHGHAVTVADEMLQSMTDAASQANIPA